MHKLPFYLAGVKAQLEMVEGREPRMNSARISLSLMEHCPTVSEQGVSGLDAANRVY